MLRRLAWCTTLLIATLAAMSFALPHWRLRRASGLVNAAYQRHRPFVYRFPGAPWVDMKPRFAEPADLRAELLALQKLEPADDPRVRTLRARVLLLSGNTDAAIIQYRLALYSGDQPATRAELAVAIALRGAADQRAVDYAQALDQIAMALHAGDRSEETQHNFAALLEHFPMPLQAAEQWKKAAQSAGTWGEEAKRRARSIENRLQLRQTAIEEARVIAVPETAGASERALDHVVGEVFAQAWTEQTRENLRQLAVRIEQRHGDRWLLDLLAQPHPPAALRSLSSARLANLRGNYRDAGSAAVEALRRIAPAQQTALWTALEAERVYALQRRGLPCAQEASALSARAASRSYLLLAIHADLDAIAGRTRLGAIDTFPAREAAYERASLSRYESAALRALGFLVERHVSLGRPLFHWSRAREGLERYWAGVVPELRAHQFYYSLAQLAEGWRRPYVAALLAAESERVLRSSPNLATYAMTLSKARLLAARTGSAYESPQRLEAILSADGFPEQAKPVVRVEIAETATMRGRPDDALATLAANGVPKEFGHFSRLFHAQARGDAHLAKGRLDAAESCYREVISENDKRLVNIANGVQRDASCRELETSYRGLTDIQLRQGRAAEALATWRLFRSAGRERAPAPLDRGAVALTIAALPSGVWIWLENASGLRAFKLPVHAESFARTAEMLAAVASDPEAPERVVRDIGQQLAGPFRKELEQLLDGARALIVDADGAFAAVPWPALPLAGGYLIDRAAVIQSSGGVAGPSGGTPMAEGLIVSEPSLPVSLRKEFPRLPDARIEALRISRKAPRATLIEASSATASTMKRLLPNAGFLHFAGHGIAHGGFGALLVAPEPDGSRYLLTAQELADLDLSRLQLVFLAACSAADGEPSGRLNADHLVRAFLESGAFRVIAARWAVRSSVAADIGGMFYDQWLKGRRAEDALRDAILRVRRDVPSSHPYHWAGYQIFSRH